MLLAIDTATARASIALHDGTTLRSEYTWEAANRHTVTLAARVEQMLAASEVAPADLTALAACIGPGSYTGVRIGVAFAKGMAAARGLPVAGVTTLDILAAAQPPDARPLYAVFQAGRKRVGYARYRYQEDRWQVEGDVAIATWDELAEQLAEPALLVGEVDTAGHAALQARRKLLTFPPPAWHLRRAGFLADLGVERLRAGQTADALTLTPIYVH
ncbi:MAG TPA: tRNA (adenosine(37)-N6)-threonylcarbamoyltransferase complex dimerization subunit type 1 TsaB [Anaerolineae bacterium]|nr:tRNA (adenosine(37)-N6)-threonylcarbamoyltransferase complex dimerization subunit type 1 TsaB [Anaerolineae bacterium]